MRQLVGLVGAQEQVVGLDAELGVPAHPLVHPVLVPLAGVVGRDEELHLHLLELARAEDEVARRDLVAERLADLGDPERRLLARELKDVLEVDEDALGGLRPQVDLGARLGRRPDVGLEHQVELARLAELAAALAGSGSRRSGRRPPRRSPRAGDPRASARLHLPRHWTSGSLKPPRWPDASQTRGCWMIAESIATMSSRSVSIARHHSVLDVVLEQHPVVAVVVGRADPSVDLGGGEDEAAALAERDDLVEAGLFGVVGALGACGVAGHGQGTVPVGWTGPRGWATWR